MTSNALSKALPNAWIDRLFARLAAVYGNKFADMWANQDVGDVKAFWAREMSGYTADEIRTGIESLRVAHATWPPSLYEFMDLCRPVARNTVEPEAAFHEAVVGTYARREGKFGTWSHVAIYWASVDVTAFDVLNSTWPQIRARWTRALQARLADGNLPQIPEPPKQLTAPPATDTEGRDLERVRAMLASVGDGRRNHRAWVQEILDRKARSDVTLSDVAYRMALDSAKIA